MGRIERTLQAVDDLLDIWRYIAKEKARPGAADRLLKRFDETLRLLSQSPESGVSQDRFSPGLRSFSVGNYVLFYRPLPDGIRLIRVLHGARRWEELL